MMYACMCYVCTHECMTHVVDSNKYITIRKLPRHFSRFIQPPAAVLKLSLLSLPLR